MKKLSTLLLCGLLLLAFACGEDGDASLSNESSGTGTAGSFASFVIVGDYLYAINGSAIHTYELSANGDISFRSEVGLDATLETVFPYGELLLVGSQEGVFFLDRSNLADPQFLSVYRHITACDPVVATGSIAYSTLRSTRCRFGNVDQVDVIDFSDIENPQVVNTYESVEPLGLGIRGDFLFLCEDSGVTMYNISTPTVLAEMGKIEFDGAIALDVIPADQYLVVTTNRGIYNVSFTDVGTMSVMGQVTSN